MEYKVICFFFNKQTCLFNIVCLLCIEFLGSILKKLLAMIASKGVWVAGGQE